jgi:hypothetical protein
MSTKSLLAGTPTAKSAPASDLPQNKSVARVKKTITLDAQTVKALHKLKAHISIEEDGQTDFGRIIDDAVLQLLHAKGLTL